MLILLAQQIAVGVTVAAVVVATVAVSAVSGGPDCCGSYRSGPDRSSAIRIPSAPSRATIRRAPIGCATIGCATIGHVTARIANSTSSDTYRANPSGTGTASTVSERVIGYEGRANKDDGCETYESITQHGCSPSLTVADGEERNAVICKIASYFGRTLIHLNDSQRPAPEAFGAIGKGGAK
jgi:hypothetical protein